MPEHVAPPDPPEATNTNTVANDISGNNVVGLPSSLVPPRGATVLAYFVVVKMAINHKKVLRIMQIAGNSLQNPNDAGFLPRTATTLSGLPEP
jgi:hypothetical protein